MSSKVLEGVLESIGPGQVQGGWTVAQYIDIGGRRVSNIGYSNELAYHLEKMLGKQVRLAVYGNRKGGLVAAIKGEASVVKEVKGMPYDWAFFWQTTFKILGFGVAAGILIETLFRGDGLLHGIFTWPPLALVALIVGAELVTKSRFNAAKSKLDNR